jgi:hypothetical protein
MAPPAPYRNGWQFRDGKLLRFGRGQVVVLRGWPEPLAWRKIRGGPWRHVRPDLALGEIRRAAEGLDLQQLERGEWTPRDARLERSGPLAGQLHLAFACSARERIAAGLRTRQEAARSFLALFPPEVLDLVGRFEERQWHVLQLLARCPGADDLVRSNPALAFAIASNWVFHKPAVKQPLRAARRLLRIRRRDAAAWLGFPGTESAARTLARVEAAAVSLKLAFDLRRALLDPQADRLLRHLQRPVRGALRLIVSPELRPYFTPALLEEIAAAPGWSGSLRAWGLLRDGIEMSAQLHRRVPRFSSTERLERWHDDLMEDMNADARAAYLELRFPLPPIPGTDAIEPLVTPRDLLEEGRQMRHCVASYARRVAQGESYVYRMRAPERATLEVTPTRHGWQLAQIHGRQNAPVLPETQKAALRWLERAHAPARRVRRSDSAWGAHAPPEPAHEDIPF